MILQIIFSIASVSATFSLVGTTITQSGTDTDLSGLTGIAGVTVSTKGTKQVYTLSSGIQRLIISGTLDLDPEVEELVFDVATGSDAIYVTGLFRIGKETTVNGVTRYSEGDALVMPRDTTNQWQIGSLEVRNGGEFEWRGGTIYAGDAMGCQVGGKATIYDGRFVATSASTSSSAGSAMFMRNDGAVDDVIVYNIELDALEPTNVGSVVFSTNGATQMSFSAKSAFIQARNGTHTGPMLLENVQFNENAYFSDFEFNGSSSNINNCQAVEITNTDVGTGIRYYSLSNNDRGSLFVFQNLDINFMDLSGNPIMGAKVYIPTTDSGNRVDYNTGKFQNFRSFVGSDYNLYEGTSDVSGNTPTMKILTGRFTDAGLTDMTVMVDLYGNTQLAGEDLFSSYYISYNEQLFSRTLELKSDENIQNNVVLLPDLNITEADSGVVGAYTEIDDSYKFYDRAKLYLYDNYAGEANVIVSRAGDVIDAGGYNVTVDATALVPFAFDGTTITVKASEYTGGITTTGDINFINGAEISGVVGDSDGITSLLTLTTLPADSYVYIMTNTGSTHDYVTGQSGEYNTTIPATATGTWSYVVKKPGYVPQVASFTPTGGEYSFPVNLSVQFQSNGTVMYNGSNSTLIDIEFDGISQMNIDIGDGEVLNQAVYDMTEKALVLQDGMRWLANGKSGVTISNLSSGSFIFLTDDVRFRRNSAGDVNATVGAFSISTQGTVVDNVNGGIQFLTAGANDVTIDEVDKDDIAARVQINMEADGSVLDQVYDLLQDILTWLQSIKGDSQKIW